MTTSDDALLRQAVAGDADALATLLERNGPGTRRQLQGSIPRRWQAVLSLDDVMQQTYADAFLDVRRFEPEREGTFGAWLSTLARRNLVDALRMLEAQKRGGKVRRVAGNAGEDSAVVLLALLSHSTSSPARAAARREAGQVLEQALQQLPEAQESVVRHYDLEGRRAEDVAAVMGRSTGAMFMLRARAHRRLREILGSTSRFF
ncbi:MAG TPA: RNA polymerase sigma factor [Planctomycetota bacterium]